MKSKFEIEQDRIDRNWNRYCDSEAGRDDMEFTKLQLGCTTNDNYAIYDGDGLTVTTKEVPYHFTDSPAVRARFTEIT